MGIGINITLNLWQSDEYSIIFKVLKVPRWSNIKKLEKAYQKFKRRNNVIIDPINVGFNEGINISEFFEEKYKEYMEKLYEEGDMNFQKNIMNFFSTVFNRSENIICILSILFIVDIARSFIFKYHFPFLFFVLLFETIFPHWFENKIYSVTTAFLIVFIPKGIWYFKGKYFTKKPIQINKKTN